MADPRSARQSPDPGAANDRDARSFVRGNTIANYLGRGWAAIVGLLCLPLFLTLLGEEAYGLIGAFAVLQAWTLLLDFGLTPTLNREMVRARAGTRTWQSLADLVRSIELLVALLAILIGGVVYLSAPLLASDWLRPRQLSLGTVSTAISVMGVLACARWIEQVYRAAIQGAEDQIWLNIVQAGTETARWVGALIVIRYVTPDILWFFGWNLIVSGITVAILRRRVVRLLRRHAFQASRFRVNELRAVRRFAGGMFLSSLLTFLLTQTDKLVVGAYISLAEFGIYALAATAAAGLLQLVQPLNVAVLPRFTTLVESAGREDLRRTFRTAADWMSAIVLPIALVVIIMPESALLAWTGQPAIIGQAAPILSLLMTASLLNALVNIPYMLQLAHGWTSLTNKVNVGAILLLVPVLIWASDAYAGVGAAAALVALNTVSIAIMAFLVVARLLPGEPLRWLGLTLIAPLALGALAGVLLRLSLPVAGDRMQAIWQLGVAGIAIATAVVTSLSQPRKTILAVAKQSGLKLARWANAF